MTQPQRTLRLQAHGATLDVEGQLDYFTHQQLGGELSRLCDEAEHLTVTLDMSRVDYVDSTAARHILGAAARLSKEGRRFVILGAQGQVRKMLCILGLERMLED